MKRSPFLIFSFIMALLIGGIISFIQSPQFAGLFKDVVKRYLPSDLGMEGDFTGFEVKLFPPGVSLREPSIKLLEQNVAGLPPGSVVTAERIDFVFRPVQMFSGNIRVHEVTIVKGDVRLLLGELGDLSRKKARKKEPKKGFHWDELFQFHAEAVSLRDTRLRVEAQKPALTADLVADSMRVSQWSGEGGLGYELDLRVRDIGGNALKDLPLPQTIDRLAAVARVNASGLRLDSLALAAPGLEVDGSGMLKGNVLDPKNLAFEGAASLRADLDRLRAVLGKKANGLPEAGGALSFEGKVRGAPDRLLETLRAEGVLVGRDVRFAEWTADSLRAELAWAASARGGELAVTKASIASAEKSRVGGSRPGGGGKVDVGAFKVNFGALSEGTGFSVPLTLDRAHLHWLAAPVVQKVFGLALRASGPVSVEFRPGPGKQPWAVAAKLGLKVEEFQLDNQKLAQSKPLHKVLQIPRIDLSGGVLVTPTALQLEDVAISSGGATSFKGTGKVDFKSGYDLFFSGPVDLADVGQIAENDIRGKGKLDCHVHGPASSVYVDFDPELVDAYYLKLFLGSLKGRITWDDDKNRVLFTRMQASRGGTPYQAEGVIDLDRDKDTVELGIHVPGGDIHDLTGVFADLVKDIWWFPRELSGAVRGDVRVSGGLGTDKLVVDAQLSGRAWQYLGERFETVAMRGGFDKGKYHVADFRAVKRTGTAVGRISFDRDRVIDWGFHTENFRIGDFDHFASLDVPIRGQLLIESSGKGKEGAIKSTTLVQSDAVAVRGVQMPPSHLNIITGGGKAEIKGVALGGQGTIEAVYDFEPGRPSSIKGELKHLDFSPVLLLLNPALIQDKALAGHVSGEINLSFQSGAIERASGSVALSEYVLAKQGVRFDLVHPVGLKIVDGSFDLPGVSLRGNQGEAALVLQSRRGAIEGSVSGDVDVAIAEMFTPVVSDSQGTVELDFALGGTLKTPTVFGKAVVDEVSMRVPGVESPLENVSGVLQLRQNVLSVQNMQADLGGGRVTADGMVELFADRFPLVNLRGKLSGNKLKVFPFQYVKVHGGVEVKGDRFPYLVEGTVVVDSALSREKVLSQKKGEGLKALQYTPPPSSRLSSDYPKFKLNIAANADNGVLIQNDLFDLVAKGRFTIVNTLEAPRVLGNAEVVSGKMLFKDRAFQIQSANAVFDSPTVLNPSFNLSANTDVNGTKVQMYVTGRLSKWSIELSSNPVMPESEILSLLAMGVTSGDAKRLSAADRSVFEQGEAASLLLHSLDFNRDIESKTGLQIKLDESVNPAQQGTSIFKPQSGTDAIAQPKIVIKRQIGKRFDLSYGTTLGGANSAGQRVVNAEFHFTPGFSALGVWDNYQTIDAQERISIGLDLKFQTRFK